MLRFEKFIEAHIPFYYAWRNDPEVAYFDQSGFLRPMTYDEVAMWSSRMIDGLTFTVFDNDRPIGVCSYMSVDERNRHGEISIVIGDKNYWSKGFGTQIMLRLMDYGFEGLNLNRIYLHVYSFNERAIRLYQKMGFKHEGTMRNMVYRNGKYHNLEVFGILKEEYAEVLSLIR